MKNNISEEELEIHSLIQYFSKTKYRTNNADDMAKKAMQKCIDLAKLDYNVTILDNSSGDLCAHYPSQLIIMESEINVSGELIRDTIYESTDPHRLRDLITKARSARCRARFPVPVIFFQGKFICRSATLSGGPEIYGRSGLDFFFAGEAPNNDQNDQPEDDNNQANGNSNNWVLCDQVRKEDIKLLKALNVGTIVDFMVEKKKVKFGLNVTSSEKVDKENRYSEFSIMSLPYPGCEFFREYSDNNYSADNLFYNWEQTFVDADIIVPQDSISERIVVRWTDYKKWSLVNLTENYLLLLLRYTFDSSNGLLVHCISGWDRTPLFVSLLRICLWADGTIHRSLTPIQMLYFTIAYDWLLFGHDFPDRRSKNENIFYFCFDYLKHVMGDEFSCPRARGRAAVPRNPAAAGEEYMQCDNADLESGDLVACTQGSNHSLHSSWSSISSKSQEANPTNQGDDLNNVPMFTGERISDSQQSSSSSGSGASTVVYNLDGPKTLASLSPNKDQAPSTSPVAVPSRSNLRHRNESCSLSVGSWQYVSSTGSLRSTTSSSTSRSGEASAMVESSATLTDAPDSSCLIRRKNSLEHAQCGSSCAVRRERLEQIRRLFLKCYHLSIGHNIRDGSSSILEKLTSRIYNPKT